MDGFASKCVSDQIEMKLTKVEEVFFNNIPRDKTLIHFLHMYHRFGDIKLYWRPMSENKK